MAMVKIHRNSVIGIDIGSVTLSIVQMDLTGQIQNQAYIFHKGKIRGSLLTVQKDFDLTNIVGISCTTVNGITPKHVHIYDPQIAIIAATKKLCKQAGSILMVGAEKFLVIKFDKNGNYEYTNTNSSCAAGTGSFLDQQAFRLNLSSIEELSEIALQNKEDIPDIASRCAVFAKTDLIHAQQKGYSIGAICDSLCKGLAKNITDTLFSKVSPSLPILFIGGVSKNQAVIKHLEQLLNTSLLQHKHSHLFGAIGACYMLLQEKRGFAPIAIKSLDEIFDKKDSKKEYYHKPLSLNLSQYPDFSNSDSYLFTPIHSSHSDKVQVDFYTHFNENQAYKIYLGVDIGSTSTKAIITGENKEVFAGFYTYTAGNPLCAIKSLFEAIDDIRIKKRIKLSFLGVGTTGSGRKFIGKIIGSDLIVDEITAHARAAYELNPKTDTIIEIGGQDAKFTLMHDGIVTFSQMNSVCAAGTGSFIEEQSKKLDCTLTDYSKRAENVKAPYASDRCTVFMERDINQLLNKGFTVNEILATALQSVMENYLKKVATEASIGNNICFQGATAKNKSLIATFEQKLQKPIFVSKYCHLTGALGVALLLHEENISKISNFRGLEIYKEDIPITSETCRLCTNNCHISMATIQGEKVAYGFICGRDFESMTISKKNVPEFNLLKERNKILSRKQEYRHGITIGLPASLHLFEELILWKHFFNNLSIRTISSENFSDPLKTGKCIAGAEFCAPIDSMYGHALYLASKVDYIFIPVILEAREKPKDASRNFCYYTQFSSTLVHALKDNGIQDKCLSPFLDLNKGNNHTIQQLAKCLKPFLKNSISYTEVRKAYEEALIFYQEKKKKLIDLFEKEFNPENDLSVVLMGRPYIVLSKTMNKGIPDIFSKMNVKTFYQDMISSNDEESFDIKSLLKKVPWHYAAEIIEKAKTIATTKNLYPVLITAFKCAPDSFIIEYFKKILNKHHKPYLILQIDEHDTNEGYETRIEAAMRSFRNHSKSAVAARKIESFEILPHIESKVNGKTLLFPDWDPIVSPLIVANLQRIGIDARLLKSSDIIIKKSMAHNTGQCLPVNIITQEFIDYVENSSLNPENTMLWMIESKLSCNLKLYPYFTKNLLETYGKGFEKAKVYCGPLTHLEFSVNTCYYAYFAYMLGGLIRKLACKIRPYEVNKGSTDNAIKKSINILKEAFLGNKSMDSAVSEALSLFDDIDKTEGKRPKVAIFGDFYVRDNDIMNQNLIHAIEEAGGEAITTPYNDLVKITIENILRRDLDRGDYSALGLHRVIISIFKIFDKNYYNKYFKKHLGKNPVINPKRLEKHLADFNIDLLHSGESYDNILKIFYLLENHSDISLFVQTNPAYCCPSLITEAMTSEIKRITGIPVVTLTYDGTGEYQNDIIKPYLQNWEKVS